MGRLEQTTAALTGHCRIDLLMDDC